MKTSWVLFGAAAAIFAAIGGWVLVGQSGLQANTPPRQADIKAGETLYGEYCAACHGDKLEGQPEWRTPGADGRLPAPPHDVSGHTWHHSDQVLFDYAKLGGRAVLARQGVEYDSGMPGFSDDLKDDEIWNILAFIKSTWPERARKVQAERTSAETKQGEN